MELTGLPLLVLAWVLVAAAVVATGLLWSRYRRWRLLARTASVLFCELLLVVTVGIGVNRADQFYPSWQVLLGDTGGVGGGAGAAPRPQGRLDLMLGQLSGAGHRAAALPWQPAGWLHWRLSSAPSVVVPADYVKRAAVSFPAVVSVLDGATPDAKSATAATGNTPDAVGVVATGSPQTLADPLSSALPTDLGRDLRVTTHGWALVVSATMLPLAEHMIRKNTSRYAALVVLGDVADPNQLTAIAPANALAVAVVRSAPVPGRPPVPLPAGVKTIVSANGLAWSAAASWAIQQTALPLAAPMVLPSVLARANAPQAPQERAQHGPRQ